MNSSPHQVQIVGPVMTNSDNPWQQQGDYIEEQKEARERHAMFQEQHRLIQEQHKQLAWTPAEYCFGASDPSSRSSKYLVCVSGVQTPNTKHHTVIAYTTITSVTAACTNNNSRSLNHRRNMTVNVYLSIIKPLPGQPWR